MSSSTGSSPTSSEDDHPGTTGANPAIADPETSEELFVLSLSRIPVLKFDHFTMVIIVVHVWQGGQAQLRVKCCSLSSKRESPGCISLRMPVRSRARYVYVVYSVFFFFVF